jgi:cobalt-zinc-cadmium resistance protein CzcA
MSQFGLNVNDVNNVVNTAFAGQSTAVYEGEKRFDLVVRLSGDQRKNIEDVNRLLISTPSGIDIPLSSVANVELKESINQIQRENAQKNYCRFQREKQRHTIYSRRFAKNGRKNLKLPSGYSIKYGGTFENLQQAKSRLSIAVPISLLLILLMLYFSFNSVKYGLLFSLPFRFRQLEACCLFGFEE